MRIARKTNVTGIKRTKLKLHETRSKRSNRREVNSKCTRHHHNNRIEDQTRSERDTNVTIVERIKLKVHETLT